MDEIIYRVSDSQYAYGPVTITVAELDKGLTEISTFATDEINDMAVGNLDNDASLELVLTNGMVYGLATGEAQWELGTDELVVSDCQWGNVTAYTLNSSKQLEVLWQFELFDHGSTSLTLGNVETERVRPANRQVCRLWLVWHYFRR